MTRWWYQEEDKTFDIITLLIFITLITLTLSSNYSTLKVILRILRLLCQSRTAVTLGVTCAILFGLCVPIYAFIFGNFVNVFTNRTSSSEVEKKTPSSTSSSSTTFGLDNDYLREQARNYGFQFLGLAFFAFLSSFLQNSFFHIASQRLVTALRLLAFNSMLAKPITWHERPQNSASRLCTTLANDPSDIQSSTGPRIAMLCQAGAALVVAVAFGLYTCWSLSLVALAFVPLIAYSSSSRVELFGEQNTKEAERNAEAAAVGAEAMANIRTVASLHREAFFERYYASLLEMNVREVHCSIHKKSLHAAWALGCPVVAYATVFLYGGHLVANHELSSGDFFRVIEAMIFGAIVFGQACFFSSDFAKAKAAAIALFELIDSSRGETSSSSSPSSPSSPPPPTSSSSSPSSPPLSPPQISPPPSSGMTLHLQYGRARGEISFRRVSFSYPSRPSVQVLREVTFHVAAGQKVALVGASGCGKTTILQLLERFYEPSDGLILLDGVSTANLSTSWLRAQMALVAQEPTLFNSSIRENIAYGDTSRPSIPLAEIEEAARKAAIHGWIASLPAGYETVVGAGGCQLSGGQKQRIAIARTWIRNPPILLLDEATSALDSNSEKQIQSTLEAALVGRTVITIAHRLSTVANADLILYLHQGAIVESGSHEELLARRGHYWGLWNHQRTAGGLSSSNRTSKVDLVALEREKGREEEKIEKINIVEREFRV
ncbi:Pgp-2p [Tyrophagus putrescentiae]|nr:Pgp-2p [Tyrophagus putrescentiae]